MKTRRMWERVRGTPADSPPEWLPNGWTVAVRNTRHGEYRCYRSPVSGCTFQSKEEVLHHLSVVKHDNGTSRRASCSNKSQNQSPASAKKLKSQPTGKEHHGELSNTAIVPDRLLLATSSQENIEVKLDEENAQESATLSPLCPLNPREKAPKNGRISQSKCTRKSNISNEKTNVGREENIKLEEVTEKPSDLTMKGEQFDGKELAKHTENEANQGRGSKPETATNSNENSKEEDMAMTQIEYITPKFPMASNETSKNQLSVPDQKASAEKGHFSDPQIKNLSELEKELPVVGNPSTPDLVKPKHGSRKTKEALNAISRPQRLSRWLACVEADLATDVDMGGEHPHESKSKNMQASIEGEATEAAERLRRKNTIEDKARMMNRATMEWPDFPSTLPLGDSWFDDPCLEFAFKTLTGDLPVLDDAIAIQEYFQQQLVSGSTSPDVLGPASKSKAGGALASDEVEIKLPSEQDRQEMCQLGVMEKK